ncbi:hypothetical protein [Virgibacillus halodenitrificans]|uniref:hypothetical protein n=1 Tax=Virgibacillus halodenitrificans TaxID=1482 RepID=UPI0007621F38
MTQEEAISILETIEAVYPKFELNPTKARLLVPKLMKMEYQGVNEKLADFTVNHIYPPTIAEIAVYLPETNVHTRKINKWRKEAANVSQAKKEAFAQAFKQLSNEKVK